jgi:uncharacterized protein (UPF0335 family)
MANDGCSDEVLRGRGVVISFYRLLMLRKKDQAERQEEETILDLYKAALGMV